jgi:hypothetical protein
MEAANVHAAITMVAKANRTRSFVDEMGMSALYQRGIRQLWWVDLV